MSSHVRLPSRARGPLSLLSVRILIATSALVVTAIVVYFEGDCYADRGELGQISWIDAFYYATVTLSTTGYGDITPVCESARIANILVITPLRFVFLITLVGTTVEVLTHKTRVEFRTHRWRQRVHDHTVIIGFGVKGRSAASLLLDNGEDPLSLVVITPDRDMAEEANRMGLVAVQGDARREDIQRDAAVDRSAKVVVATDSDDTAILVTLTARRLNPTADIVASVRETANADLLRQSGATTVIPTAESSGHLMALSLVSPVAGGLMEDLLDTGRGLEIVQRPISRSELGVAPSELQARGEIVLAVIRHGKTHRFDSRDIRLLQQGDDVVVIRQAPTKGAPDVEES